MAPLVFYQNYILISFCSQPGCDCYIGQAKNIYEANEWLENLYSIIQVAQQATQTAQGSKPIQTHSSIANQLVCADITLYEWINRNTKQKNITIQSIARLLLKIITNKPFIDSQGILNSCECYFKEKNISNSSLAGAAYYQGEGVLISFQSAEDFVDDSVTVKFRENEQKDAQDIVIINLTKVEQTTKVCRRYQASPKHRKRGELGKKGTEMDLTDEEAQLALNEGIAHGRQIYSYFKSKFYEFQSDNAGTFHGYPILEEDVPHKVIKKLNL